MARALDNDARWQHELFGLRGQRRGVRIEWLEPSTAAPCWWTERCFTDDYYGAALTRYTLNALQSGYIAPRPDPMQLRPHLLR